jgi:hypothetical protein
VIHELVHALQHQHFPRTLELMQTLRHNDDVVLALGSAAEGDAMLVMLLYSLGSDGDLPPTNVELLRAGLRADLENPSGMLSEVPRIVRLSLVFPYAAGFDMAEREYRAAGRTGLDRMLGEPPLSSLRVREPGAVQPVEFVRLPAARAAARAGGRCRAGHDNVAGALGIEALFSDHGAPDAAPLAREWSGDRFLRVDCPRGAELLWVTRWTTPEAAAAFAAAYARIAPSVARVAPLAGTPRVETRGRTALVATPRLADAADDLLGRTEIRAFASFGEWVRAGCFPESPCPAFGP